MIINKLLFGDHLVADEGGDALAQRRQLRRQAEVNHGDGLSCGSATGEMAAVDTEGDAGDEAGLVGGEVDRRAGDI